MQPPLFRRDRPAACPDHHRHTAWQLCAGATILFTAAPFVAAQTSPVPPAAVPAPATQTAPPQTAAPVSQPASASQAPTAPASSPAGNAQASTVDAEHYIIGPEDSLQITVWKEPTLTGPVPVRPDGMISMALLNDVRAAGLSPMQLAADITTKLKKYIQDPIVSVQVNGVNSRKVFLVGEVNKIGPINLASDMTPLQAIASAGGLTTFAHSKRIYILRGAKGHEQKIPFNYKEALKGDSHQDFLLQPGDTIVVP